MYILHFAVLDVLRLALNATLFKSISSADVRLMVIFPLLVGLTYLVAKVTGKLIEDPGVRFGKRFSQAFGAAILRLSPH